MNTPPTPWKLSHTDKVVRDAVGRNVFCTHYLSGGTGQQFDTARRIMAAVNAVEYFSTLELEEIVRSGDQKQLFLGWQTRDTIQKASFA